MLKINKKSQLQDVLKLLAALFLIIIIVIAATNYFSGKSQTLEEAFGKLSNCYTVTKGLGFCISPNDVCSDFDKAVDSSILGTSCEEEDNPEETADMKCCIAIKPKEKILLELYNGNEYIDRLAGRQQDRLTTGGSDSIKITEIEVSYPEYLYNRSIKDDITKFELSIIPTKTPTKCYDGDPIIMTCDYHDQGEFTFPSCAGKQDITLNIGDCKFVLKVYNKLNDEKSKVFDKEFLFPVQI